ncbi:MAG: helix-turn-helix transcriptional regulator [Rhodospirillales bacterium]
MRFTEIGQQLRAYRLESGLRAEEIAARLGVSRAALYRYEKGEVIKLDTVNRLAELLKISPLSLLGIGVEYYNRPIGFFERLRQVEETADQILQVALPLTYLISSDELDAVEAEIFREATADTGPERAAAQAVADQVQGILAERKRMYRMRRPAIIAMLSPSGISRFLQQGVGQGLARSETLRFRARAVAHAEIEHIANLMDAEPMGLQFGLVTSGEPTGQFQILRARDRATLAINPFRTDTIPHGHAGVAMITSADEAVSAHQRVAEAMWRDSIKGPGAASRVRELLASVPL